MPPSVRAIILQVAEETGVSVGEILGRGRTRGVYSARREAMRRIRRLEFCSGRNPSFPEIGRWFGRDHTTVLHACRGLEPVQPALPFDGAFQGTLAA